MMMTVKIGIDRRSKVDGLIEGAGIRVNINMYKFLVRVVPGAHNCV